MKTSPYPVKSLISATILTFMSNHATYAGAFSLYTESSATAVGNFAAGIAAEAADASTAWYNPAGLVLLKKQELVVSGVGVFPSSKLTGTSTFTTEGIPTAYVQSFTGLQGAENALVPAMHYALPLGDNAAFGLSLVSPFGLSTRYGESSPVRYAATLTDLRTIDLSPDISGKLTENLSFGLGLDLQYARVKFNGVLGAPTIAFLNPEATATTFDSTSENLGSSIGFGFHTGLMGVFNHSHTRVGLNYQSQMQQKFRGSSTLTGRLADSEFPANPNTVLRDDVLSSNNITLPDILTLSGYQDINAKLALLGSVVYTGWSSFKTIELNHVVAGPDTYVDSVATENYRDAWRFALGANYSVNDQWMMRVGGGYDQSPTVNSARDVRLPDASRWALSVGAHYQPRYNLGVDVGYSYLFAANNPIVNKTQSIGDTSSYNVNAVAKVNAQLVGAQVVWAIDKVDTRMKS